MRDITTLQLVEAIYFRAKMEKVLRDVPAASFEELPNGLLLSDTANDIFVPWSSIIQVTYKKPKDLASEIKKSLPKNSPKKGDGA